MAEIKPPTFPLFSELPTELRLKIWHFAAMSYRARLLEVLLPMFDLRSKSAFDTNKYTQQYTCNKVAENATIPPTLLVDREARKETLRQYKKAKFSRLVPRGVGFRAFRPERDIIFSAEVAPPRFGSFWPRRVACYPLDCLAESPEDVEELQYIAIRIRQSELQHADLDGFFRVLKVFKGLKELYIVLISDMSCGAPDEWRLGGADVPMNERTLIDYSESLPDNQEQLAKYVDTIAMFNQQLSEHHTDIWRPVICLKYCTKRRT